MDKEITINDNNTIIKFSKEDVFSNEFIQLEVDFLDEFGNVSKVITFSKCDDFQISAFTFVPSFDKDISFEFDSNSILYNCFINFLNIDDEITINDSDSKEQKYVTIEKKDNSVTFKFLNKKINNHLFKDFNILIKNILTDYKRKIDGIGENSQNKLITLFESFKEICFVEYNKGNCNGNKVFTKKFKVET